MKTAADLTGTLIVTGASRGIGAAIARWRASADMPSPSTSAPARRKPMRLRAEIVADGGRGRRDSCRRVRAKKQIVRMFETAEHELGPIKGLVNNAGITGGFARVEDVTAEAIERGTSRST